MILEGEAGIGKTRLAEEFLRFSRGRGATTLAARCYAGEANLTFGPFIQALEPAASRPDLAERLAEIPASLLAEAARLLPALGDTFPNLPPLPRLDGPGAQSRFFEGVSRALIATCAQPRGILFLDDLQWSDEASLDLMTYLVRRLSGKPLCILAAWRAEEVPAGHRLRGLVREAQRAGIGTVLPLGRLERSAVAEMVRSVTEGSDRLSERLYGETEGLPLFVAEYLAAIAKGELSVEGDWSLPGGVRDLLNGRLQALGETAGQLLGAAAAIGRSFDFDTVREASGRGEEEAIAAIEELISRRLIQEVVEASGESEPLYDFYHEKLRDLVYEETSLARRRLLHRRIAASLAARALRRKVDALSGEISRHYHLAGQDEEAAEYSRLAGEHARTLYANADALSHFQTALALGHPHAASLHEAIGDLHTLTGEYGAALASYETAAALHSEKILSTIERKLGGVYGLQGEWELADIHYSAALTALEGQGREQDGERARLFADRSRLAHQRGRTAEAAELARRALDLAESAEDKRALAQAHNMLGILANSGGDKAASLDHLERSLALAEEMQDPYARVAALNNLALARGRSGETEEALALARSALALCASLGDRHREAALHNNLADLLHAVGRREESMQHLKQAVSIFAEIGESALQPEIWKLVEW